MTGCVRGRLRCRRRVRGRDRARVRDRVEARVRVRVHLRPTRAEEVAHAQGVVQPSPVLEVRSHDLLAHLLIERGWDAALLGLIALLVLEALVLVIVRWEVAMHLVRGRGRGRVRVRVRVRVRGWG